MKQFRLISPMRILCLSLLWIAGCSGLNAPKPELAAQPPHGSIKITPVGLTPAKLAILPLTKLVRPSSPDSTGYLQVYVTMSDEFDIQLKYYGLVRFELYEKIQRSAEPKGERVKRWDIDLSTPQLNNELWEDWLRAYEFHLDFSPPTDRKYVLQVTFLGPEGRRVTAQATLAP